MKSTDSVKFIKMSMEFFTDLEQIIPNFYGEHTEKWVPKMVLR